jgi:STE24 endopeptidase
VQASFVWLVLAGAASLSLILVLVGLLRGVNAGPQTLQYFSGDFLTRAADYERASLTLYLLKRFVFLGLLAFITYRVLSWRTEPRLSLLAVMGTIAAFFLFFYLITLPLDFYRGFILEHRFALSTQGAGAWFLDYGLSTLISLVISTVIFTGFYALMSYAPRSWWLLSGIALSIFVYLSSYLYPILIDPLFYKFTPLQDEVLSQEVMKMAEDAGIEVEGILVADASRRTVKANAYFSGLGKTKRIVLFDNLLNNFSQDEVMAVIAHEMGHWRYNHIFKNILLGSAGAFLSLYILKALLSAMGLAAGLKSLLAAYLFFSLLSLATMPLENLISRSFERQADREALRLTGNPTAFIDLKKNLGVANLSVVQPHPLIKAVLYSHPPIIERIGMAEKFK